MHKGTSPAILCGYDAPRTRLCILTILLQLKLVVVTYKSHKLKLVWTVGSSSGGKLTNMLSFPSLIWIGLCT